MLNKSACGTPDVAFTSASLISEQHQAELRARGAGSTPSDFSRLAISPAVP
jgi:stage V sporulation protein SpoVS